jgi:hypothetical protein
MTAQGRSGRLLLSVGQLVVIVAVFAPLAVRAYGRKT